MGRRIKVADHLSVEQIDDRIKQCKARFHIRRWMVIRHALVDPQPAEEIGLHVGLGRQTVYNLISAYNREGICAIETPGKGQRQRAYLSLEEEARFVDGFKAQASEGVLVTVDAIHAALEERVAHQVDPSTVYRLLHRHQWRKVVPRPRHPSATEQEQKAIKKTLLSK